jgi:hypothetical protein
MTEKRGVFEELYVEIEYKSERKWFDGRAVRDVDNRQPPRQRASF